MSVPYAWRGLAPSEKERLINHRRLYGRAWHSPPHWDENWGHRFFLISAACWEHQPRIGFSLARMDAFTEHWLAMLRDHSNQVLAWCVLPNHYHALLETTSISRLLKEVGLFHGRTSFAWNAEEGTRGRANFYRCCERAMRSEAHQWATINYIHHNHVHHGYLDGWQEWPWSSVHHWLEHYGRVAIERRWREYPVLDYGRGWDDPEL